MDQADRLRDLMDPGSSGKATRVIAVTSGKGGVGKTTLGLNLAIALAARGPRVGVVDMDIGLANADVLLGLRPDRNLRHVLRGQTAVREALVRAPGGIFLLPGSTGMPLVSDLDEDERRFLIRSFRDLEGIADILVIDTGAGITRNVIHFASSADEILVVTTPEPTAITDGYALIKTVSREKGFGRIRLLVNQAAGPPEGTRVCERIRMVSRRFLDLEVEELGHVPDDPGVRQAVRRRSPFVLEYPDAPASAAVRSLADRLLEERGPPARAFSERLESLGPARGRAVLRGGL